MHQYQKQMVLWVIVGLLAVTGTAWANGLKQRMQSRLSAIVDLKQRGVIGEDNKGFLSFMKGKNENKEVVDAENKDRRTVYQAIAQKQGTTVELVGQRRAIQLAEKANPGEWLQKPDGKWYQK
jgi:uncharacterized protein YdbL (DUF1318 family)